MRTGVKQEVIRMTVAIKIRHTYQVKAHWKSRATRPSDMNIATHVPNRCLASARIVKDKIRLPIVVKVSCWTHAWLPECEKSSQSGGKGASHSARSKFIDGGYAVEGAALNAAAVFRDKQITRAVTGETSCGIQPGGKGALGSIGREFEDRAGAKVRDKQVARPVKG